MNYKVSKKEILKWASNADVYRRGYQYFEQGRASMITYEEDDQAKYAFGSVDGNYKDYHVKIVFDQTGALIDYSCNCESGLIWRGACKHVVCMLLKMNEEVETYKRLSVSDQQAGFIIKAFEEKITQGVNEKIAKRLPLGTITVFPCLLTDTENRLLLSCSLGSTKAYIIKNIEEFLFNVEQEKTVIYGKELEFTHSLRMFTERSQRLIELIGRNFKNYQDIYLKITGSEKMDHSKYLYLSPDYLDELFDLYEGDYIECGIKNLEAEEILLQEGSPPIKFRVQVDGDQQMAVISAEDMEVCLLEGRQFHYLTYDQVLYKMDKSSANAIKALSETISADGEITFFGEKYRGFINKVLPALTKMGMLETENLAPMASAPLFCKFYFDMEKRDLSVKVIFDYGNGQWLPGEAALDQAVLLRDFEKEYEILRMLDVFGFEAMEPGIYGLKNDEKIYDFLLTGIGEFNLMGEVYISDSVRNKVLRPVKVSFGAAIKANLLEIEIDPGDYTMAELYEAVANYSPNKKYHRLKNGAYIDLQNSGISALSSLINTFEIEKKDFLNNNIAAPKYRALTADTLFGDYNGLLKQDESFKDFVLSIRNSKDTFYEVPEKFTSILRNYQKVGYTWLSSLTDLGLGGILADDMGLGKTIQIIALLYSRKKEGAVSIVVAPTSLIYNWENEFNRFAPELKTTLLIGLPPKRKELFLENQDTDVFITTYDMLKRDLDHYDDFSFEFVIADEAQYIKNPQTQNAKAIKILRANNKFALTGTPIENSLNELWSIFDFIMPGYLYSHRKFLKRYDEVGETEDPSGADQLKKQIAPFVLRRMKSDVLKELPDKVETTIYADLTKEQKKLYIANYLKAKGQFDDGEVKSKLEIITQITRLRQICCHPSLFVKDYKGGSGKLDITVETIKQAISSGHRVLLFSQFTSMLQLIKEELDACAITYFYLDGATPSKQRASMAEAFNEGSKDIFLISLKAGGTGLNLTGADVVIHYDQWWNPAVMDQASDRAHRYGQKRAVQVINIVAKDSIEESILKLQLKKKALVDAVIDKGENFLYQLSDQDIAEIFL